MIINYTFSKYIAKADTDYSIKVAKFSVKINGKSIEDNETFNLILSENDNPNNKITPDSEGYFDIEIDPTGTEVSLEYELKIDLPKIANLNAITLTKYSLDKGNTFKDILEENTIRGEINLRESTKAFEISDKETIRIYWEWIIEEDIINPVFSDTNIKVTSIIRQKI